MNENKIPAKNEMSNQDFEYKLGSRKAREEKTQRLAKHSTS